MDSNHLRTAVRQRLFLKKDDISVVRRVVGTEPRMAARRTKKQGGREAKVGETVAIQKAVRPVSRDGGRSHGGFDSSSFLLMSLSMLQGKRHREGRVL